MTHSLMAWRPGGPPGLPSGLIKRGPQGAEIMDVTPHPQVQCGKDAARVLGAHTLPQDTEGPAPQGHLGQPHVYLTRVPLITALGSVTPAKRVLGGRCFFFFTLISSRDSLLLTLGKVTRCWKLTGG